MGKLVKGVNDLATLHPHLAKQLRTEQDKNIALETLLIGSRVKVWWICEKDPRHEWLAAVRDRVRGSTAFIWKAVNDTHKTQGDRALVESASGNCLSHLP